MTEATDDLYIAPPEVEIGVARRACPKCAWPLLVRLPPVVVKIDDRESAALKFGLDNLSQQERDIFDAIYQRFPYAVTHRDIEAETDPYSHNSFKQSIFRLRPKLAQRGWRLISTRCRGTLRLVEPECSVIST